MRSSRSLVAAGFVLLGLASIVLALVVSIARANTATAQLEATATASAGHAELHQTPGMLTATAHLEPTSNAVAALPQPAESVPFTLGVTAASTGATPGDEVAFQLNVAHVAPGHTVQTRAFISGPATVVAVDATGGSCAVAHPVVCMWSPDAGFGSARMTVRVALDAAPGMALSIQAVAQDSGGFTAASSPSSISVIAQPGTQISQLATATTRSISEEGAPAQPTAANSPPTAAPPTATQIIATATPLPAETATSASEPTVQATPAPSPTIGAPSTGALPETATTSSVPVIMLGLFGGAMLVLGVRRIRAANRNLRAQGDGVRRLANVITAVQFVQRRTRITTEDMVASSADMSHEIEHYTRR